MSFTNPRDGSSSQNAKQTVPVGTDPVERPQSVPIGSARPSGCLTDISAALRAFSRGEAAHGRTLSRIVSILNFGDEDDVSKERALESCVNQMEQIKRMQL